MDLISLLTKQQLTSYKSLSLGLTVKHLTGSKELVNILHRLGHCCSYESIRNYETSLAHHINSTQQQIPTGFTYGELVCLVWDNIDFSEETKSGHGTTHHTNGIIIQLDRQVPVPTSSNKRVPRGPPKPFQQVPDVIMPLPTHSKTNPVHLSDVVLPDCVTNKQIEVLEFIYALVRQQVELPNPSWTGLNKLVRGCYSSPNSLINYLQVISAPPTDVDVVNHVLQKSVDQADKFGLENIVVVFDQAVYSKAQTVRFLNPILLSRVVPHLGEFHTTITFLGVIGKRYGDAGMKEIITESQCIAEGSMKGVLNG
jgi:hypothetical protein